MYDNEVLLSSDYFTSGHWHVQWRGEWVGPFTWDQVLVRLRRRGFSLFDVVLLLDMAV